MPEIALPKILKKEDIQRLPPHEREHYVKQIIRETIHMNHNGVTAGLIAKSLGFDPRIVDKHLSVMLHTNEIYTMMYDSTTVYFPNTRALHPISEHTFPISEDTEIQTFKLKNRLGDFIFIQTKKKNEYRIDVNSGILIPMDKFPEFVQYMKEQLVGMMKGA